MKKILSLFLLLIFIPSSTLASKSDSLGLSFNEFCDQYALACGQLNVSSPISDYASVPYGHNTVFHSYTFADNVVISAKELDGYVTSLVFNLTFSNDVPIFGFEDLVAQIFYRIMPCFFVFPIRVSLLDFHLNFTDFCIAVSSDTRNVALEIDDIMFEWKIEFPSDLSLGCMTLEISKSA